MNYDNPLVSIIVITYNSAKYVLETLESTKIQTYDNIELIISDDCSTDNTIQLCKEWLQNNKAKFVRTELIVPDENTGIPANCNRGLKVSKGEWIKFIAGDDALLKNSIEDNVSYISKNKNVRAVFSAVNEYDEEFTKKKFIKKRPKEYPKQFFNKKTSAADQYKYMLLRSFYGITPSAFLNRKLINEVGEFDERFKFIEDYPMWLKITRHGAKLHYFDKATVLYRKHDKSVHNHKTDKIKKPSYFRDEAVRRAYVYPNVPKLNNYSKRFIYAVSVIFEKTGLNKEKPINLFLYRLCTIYINVPRLLLYVKKYYL